MLENPQLYLFVLFVSVAIFWVIPREIVNFRRHFILSVSMLFTFSIAPVAVLVTFLVCSWIYICQHYWKRIGRHKWQLYIGVLAVVSPLLVCRLFGDRLTSLETLGIAFVSIKSVGIIIDCYRLQGPIPFVQILLTNFFFPIYSSGPVEPYQKFSEQKFAKFFNLSDLWYGFSRVTVGLFKTAYLGNSIVATVLKNNWSGVSDDLASYSWSSTVLFVFLKFLFTYINFSGYSDIAIGAARMFGFKATENFNYPFLAKNMQDYWRRWHISLGSWVMRYLFFPLATQMRKLGVWSIPIASLIAFVLLGFWHEFNINFLLWGVFHGAGLAIVQLIEKVVPRKHWYRKFRENVFYGNFCRFCTVFYAAWLQTIANLEGFGPAKDLTLKLIGVL